MNHLTDLFGKPLLVYTQKQAIDDGILVKTGEIMPGHIPVVFTSNLFSKVKDNYKQLIDKGLELLKQPNKEDSDYMKLRVLKKNLIWVVANSEGVTFMKPEDY
jgi:hypothetical protein